MRNVTSNLEMSSTKTIPDLRYVCYVALQLWVSGRNVTLYTYLRQ